MQLQKVEEANSDYDLAVTLDPQNPDVYHNRGQVVDVLSKKIFMFKRFQVVRFTRLFFKIIQKV